MSSFSYPSSLLSLAATIALAAALSACGDDDDPGGSAGSSPANTGGQNVGAGGSGVVGGGGNGVVGGGGGGQVGGGQSQGGNNPACDTLVAGNNDGFMVDGEARSFVLSLPSNVDTAGPWPVVFNWHGLGDTAQNMSYLLSSHVDNVDFPFIAVTPEDTNHTVFSVNLDWDVFQVTAQNKEARLFDEVLACLHQRYGVDFNHVHSVGFSLGGIVTDMLGTIRGEQLASVVTFSGG